MTHPPRSAFGASPQGAPPAARQSRFRGVRLAMPRDASMVVQRSAEQMS
jgi:hypothetical protein